MARDDISAFLALEVMGYRLALNADGVVAILGEVAHADTVTSHDARVDFVDLQPTFGGVPRPIIPFGVVLEHGTSHGAVGVDRVDHLRFKTAPPLLPLPAFGLKAPELFAGVLRDERGLLLVLEATACIALTSGKKFAI